jgi:uncharacterized protein (DUF2336 family)
MDQSSIPNLEGLAELARRGDVDIKPTLLRVMTDFYVQKPKHSAEQERRYTELAVLLLDHADAETRAVIAAKLENYASPPPAVMQRLLREEFDTSFATPVKAAPFAGGKAVVDELNELFFAGTADERQLILLNLQYAPLLPAAPIPPGAASDAVRKLETAALSHNSETFAHELERALDISRVQARRVIEDQSGEPLLVAAAALAMPEEILQRILLCLNPIISRSVQRVYELSTLYAAVEPEAALRLLAIWRASRKRTKPAATSYGRDAESDARSAPAERQKFAWDQFAQRPSAKSA